jgi:hypothetical protein
MATRNRPKRNKNEPTTGDKLHQAYRNRAAMARVHEAAVFASYTNVPSDKIRRIYWTPFNMDDRG